MTESEIEEIERLIKALPGATHLFRIREALNDGYAATMVGSGFSRNAENGEQAVKPLSPSSRDACKPGHLLNDRHLLRAMEQGTRLPSTSSMFGTPSWCRFG